jgi:hypothetical protein
MPNMHNRSAFPSILALGGACLGAIIGFGLIRAGEYAAFATAVTSMGVVGASAGFFAGIFIQRRIAGSALNAYSPFALSILMLCGGAFSCRSVFYSMHPF